MTSTIATAVPGLPRPAALRDRPGRSSRRPAPAAPHRPESPASPAGEEHHAVVAVPADACRIREVRHFASAVLAQWGVVGDDLDSCLLIVGELAGNSAQHGRADLTVALSLRGRCLHIDVTDHGAAVEPHTAGTPSAAGEHGRGLAIVQALSDRCETQQQPSGWRTRASLRVTPAVRDRRPAGSGLPIPV
ncbi:ATP-binding protein [Streptomyces sp. 3214.6]|uniref:ATP-binding protein n=1 Tax=Streptomyces sp. 3214.6 TaxID=1882757 RepID=UPI0009A70FAE|nr:ATP-binding protein [Streptomyces sp. 3214.6]